MMMMMMIAISLACDRLWSHSRVNDLIAIRSWSRQALKVKLIYGRSCCFIGIFDHLLGIFSHLLY